jgi:hypothetical protein
VRVSETRFSRHPHPIGSPSAIKASNADDADYCWSDEVVAITNNLSATEPVCENSRRTRL